MFRAFRGSLAATVLLALPVQAATYTATSATLAAIFAKAAAGDTIKLSGGFGATYLSNRSFATAVTIDARSATFTGTLVITSVTGLKVLGGHYGSATSLLSQAVRVNKSELITFSSPVIVGDGTSGHGIDFNASRQITVDSGSFTGLRSAVALTSVTGAIIRNNKSLRASSDGFDVADSHTVKLLNNSCADTRITAGAHPDCVQLWSIAGHARQSDIEIRGNTATGATQGFTSFNPDDGGGLRIKIIGNRVDTSFPQGIACYNCDYSAFQDNVLTTQAGAQFRTSINIVGGSNNVISGNSVGAYVKPSSLVAYSTATDGGFDTATDSFADMFPDFDPSVTSVPEPGVWAMLIAGFGMAGAMLRRRRVALA